MWKAATAITFAAALAGCITIPPSPIVAGVESTVRPEFNPTAIHMVAKGDAVQRFDPEFDASVLATARALEAAGLRVLPPDQTPTGTEVVVTISYVSEPPVTSTYTSREPVYAETGVASSRTVEKINKKGEKVTTTTYEPRISVVGYEDREHSSTRFPLRLTLKGYDPAEFQRQPKFGLPLWSVVATMPDGGHDRAGRLPFLLKAAQGYIGKPVGHALVTTEQDDPGVAFIRTGVVAPPPKVRRN